MKTPLRTSRLIVAACALAVIVVNLGGIAAAVQVGSGTLGGFEIDGNFAVDSSGHNDWANITPTFVRDDTADSGFTQGSKELKPSDWVCGTGGATPNKGNLLRAYVASQVTDAGAFIDLGFVAQNISGRGDVHVNFEFSQSGTADDPDSFTPGDCPIPRRAGDLLVTYDYPGGKVQPTVGLYKWQPAAHPDGNHDGDWIDQNLPASAAKAAVNAVALDDPIGGTNVDAGRFGEATIDLHAAVPQEEGAPCRRFGYVNVRSRSSGESITSAIQDKLPTTAVDLSTCGTITLHKVDDHVPAQALSGARFGLFDKADATGDPVDTCTSATNGTCTFNHVDPGDYWVREIAPAPAGYSADPDIVAVSVEALQTVDIAAPFVDPRDVGSVRIIKDLRDGDALLTPDDATDLDGASFVVYKDANANGVYDAGEGAKLWPGETADAACTIAGGDGACVVGPLPTGAYRVHEVTPPPGSERGPDVGPVVVSSDARVDVHYANPVPPLNITIVKSATRNDDVAAATSAHVSDTVHYVFAVSTSGPRLHSIAVAELTPNRCDGAISGPTKTGGNADDFLEPGEIWTYRCDHVVVADDPSVFPNNARVTGIDDFGRVVTDDDSYTIDILHPAIEVAKSASPTSVEPGQSTTYTYVVTNTGDTILSNVIVTDDVLGSVGSVDSLAPGSSSTLTKTVGVQANSPRTNIATACGVDALDLRVCATAQATISIVLPLLPEHRAPAPQRRVTVTPPQNLPHTGFRLFLWVAIGIDLVAVGVALLEAQRRLRRA